MSTVPNAPSQHASQIPAPTNPPMQLQHPPWDTEAPYCAALARLERLQAQIDTLRMTVPILMRCFTAKNQTPESLFHDFRDATMTPSNALVALRKMLEESETVEVFERARHGPARNVVLDEGVRARCVLVPPHGWVAREPERGVKRKREELDEEGEWLGDEDMKKRVRSMEQKKGVISAKWDSEHHNVDIKVRVPASPVLNFAINRRTSGKMTEKHAIYTIKGPSCDEKLKSSFALYAAINRCLEKRPEKNNLDKIVDMIVAYKDLREAKCYQCKELLDKFAMTPAARRSHKVKNEKGVEEEVWVAVHESCLDDHHSKPT